ncbi:MAG: sensor histidine kinase [bacterium]
MQKPSQFDDTPFIAFAAFARAVSTETDHQRVLNQVLEFAMRFWGAGQGLLLQCDRASTEFRVAAVKGLSKKAVQNILTSQKSVLNEVKKRGKLFLMRTAGGTRETPPAGKPAWSSVTAAVYIPLHFREASSDILYLDKLVSQPSVGEETPALFTDFAVLLSQLLERFYLRAKMTELGVDAVGSQSLNVAEIKRRQAEVEQAIDKLQKSQMQMMHSEKMAALGALIAGVAHDINTPLGAIISNNDTVKRSVEKLQQLLKKAGGLSSEKTETLLNLLELIRVNKIACERIKNIVRNLRIYTSMETVECVSFDLHKGIDNTLRLIAHLSRDRIKIRKNYGKIPTLCCVADQLNQVFMNILVNACQAISGKGQITITTYPAGRKIHIDFEDSGSGIPSEHLDKLFEPGFTTKEAGKGTGLGLFIASQIMREHGGAIEVESEVGKGTVFKLTLPMPDDSK